MDGDRLATGAFPRGRIHHAAGLYQRAAHGAHPGGSTDRRQHRLYPLLQVRRGLGAGGDRAQHRQRSVCAAGREDHWQAPDQKGAPELPPAGRRGAGGEPCGRGLAHSVLVRRGGVPHGGSRAQLAAGSLRPCGVPQ